MDTFTTDEIDDIIKAMSLKELTQKEKAKIPLLPPGSYGKIAKVAFSQVEGETPLPAPKITEKEKNQLADLPVHIEVLFGKTKLPLKQIAAFKEGSLIPLNELADDLVEVYANGEKIARGEIVAIDGRFGIRLLAFTKN